MLFLCCRVFWLLCFLTTSSFFSLMMTKQTVRYFKHPKSTRVRVEELRPMPFPAVTICNLNLYRKSAFGNDTFLSDLMKDGYSGLPPTLNVSDPEIIKKASNINMTEFALKASHTLRGTLDQCRWLGETVCCDEVFRATMTQMGKCFTFNSVKYITEKGEALSTFGTGTSRGLYLRLNVGQDEYTYGMNMAAGFKASDVASMCGKRCRIFPGLQLFRILLDL